VKVFSVLRWVNVVTWVWEKNWTYLKSMTTWLKWASDKQLVSWNSPYIHIKYIYIQSRICDVRVCVIQLPRREYKSLNFSNCYCNHYCRLKLNFNYTCERQYWGDSARPDNCCASLRRPRHFRRTSITLKKR